jgi:alkyl sulfatase BDS1-like metallo-beta-lactamase superfamily hydrolase
MIEMFPTRYLFRRPLFRAVLLLTVAVWAVPTVAISQLVTPKPATEATKAANESVRKSLPFDDGRDFEDARRGLLARPESTIIRNAAGKVVWDLEEYKKFLGLDTPSPETVNPSLWRNAQLCLEHGLFQVTDRIYQVRGFDLSNITFVQGDTGWIVLDPLISEETAKAALDLANAKLGKRPIVAIIYSHSHVDHYGGAKGLVTDEELKSGKIQIFGPQGFEEEVVSENVIAGNAMGRRAIYVYGASVPHDVTGSVNDGLGQNVSSGNSGLIAPTTIISKTPTEITVDGVQIVFQYTPGTEAPTEMNAWFPQFKALWTAENCVNTMHNILTLRGAQVRDARKWAFYLNETMELFSPHAEVRFQSHHWPMWGNARIVEHLTKQRDLYKYIHDQSVNLMNKGYTGAEIAEMIQLPPELERYWPNRGYYGTLKHNSRAVYQRYMGWYDGNPSSLDELPPEPAAKKYVEYMGGEEAVLKRARTDFDKGEYRWVAEVVKHVVFANPKNAEAKELLADTYEQLGYQSESATWRNIYLQGAFELRNGIHRNGGITKLSPDTVKAITPELMFDFLAVRLDGKRAAGKTLKLDFYFTDLDKRYGVTVMNGVLNYGKPHDMPEATLEVSKDILDAIQIGATSIEVAILKGEIKVTGSRAVFIEFMSLLDTFPFWFDIVTP